MASFGYVPRSDITGSWGRTFPSFLRKYQIYFQSGCTILHNHQQWMSVPLVLHLCQYILSLEVLILYIRRWKDLLCSWIGRVNILKLAILPKAIYRVCNSHQNFNAIFIDIAKTNLNFIRKKKNAGKLIQSCTMKYHHPWFQTIPQIYSYQHKNRQVGQLNKIKDPDINIYTYGYLTLD